MSWFIIRFLPWSRISDCAPNLRAAPQVICGGAKDEDTPMRTRSGGDDAAETDVAGGRIGRERIAGRDAVAATVRVMAEIRAAACRLVCSGARAARIRAPVPCVELSAEPVAAP